MGVQRTEGGKAQHRRTPTLTAGLRQAVLAEGTRLRASGLATQLRGSASSETGEETSVAQLGLIASSAEQPASIKAVPSRIVGAVGCASGKRCQDVEQSADSFTLINALSVWLEAQGDESGSPELRRLRSATAVLA